MKASLKDIESSFEQYAENNPQIESFRFDLGKQFPKDVTYPLMNIIVSPTTSFGTGQVHRNMKVILMEQVLKDGSNEIDVLSELEYTAEDLYNFYSTAFNKAPISEGGFADEFDIDFNVSFDTMIPIDTADDVIAMVADVTVRTMSMRDIRQNPMY